MARWRAMIRRADSTMSTVAASLRSAPAQNTGCERAQQHPVQRLVGAGLGQLLGEVGDQAAGERVAVGGGVEGEHRDAVVVGPVHQCVAHGPDPSHFPRRVPRWSSGQATRAPDSGQAARMTWKTGMPGATAAISASVDSSTGPRRTARPPSPSG